MWNNLPTPPVNALRRYQLQILPLGIILRKIFRHARKPIQRWRHQQWRLSHQPYSTTRELPWEIKQGLKTYLVPPSPQCLNTLAPVLDTITQHCIGNRMYVLGCGWITPYHGVDVPGFETYRYTSDGIPHEMVERGRWLAMMVPSAAVPRAQWLWNSIERSHQPFDWQRDFRSGYRWNERWWYHSIRLDPVPAADPKVPWELGRLQLLPLLALHAHHTKDSSYRRQIIEMIETIILDFMAQNPPGYGIQWASPMDCAIRLANILVTHDLISTVGIRAVVEEAIILSAFDHARFVLNNLEWSEGMRGNHYLACIAGLSVAAAYFPDCRWTGQLRTWCARTLIGELSYQFLPDGGNFEASLSYHRLSAEMVGWAVWFLRQTPEGSAALNTADISSMIARIADFTLQTTYQSGIAPQIGDNDSGRFLWFLPYEDTLLSTVSETSKPYFSHRTHRETIALMDAVVSNTSDILNALVTKTPPCRSSSFLATHFGVAVLRRQPCEVFLRAGSIGQYGKGGHAHNDQLSITFALDGAEIIVDTGTGVYLASPQLRNHFRSTRQHNTLVYDAVEQNTWVEAPGEALFWLTSNRADARIVAVGVETLFAEHHAYGIPHRRVIELQKDRLIVKDYFVYFKNAQLCFHLHPSVTTEHAGGRAILRTGSWQIQCIASGSVRVEKGIYSHSYGVWCPTNVLVIAPDKLQCRTEFRWEHCS